MYDMYITVTVLSCQQGQDVTADSMFLSTGDAEEEELNYDENISFPTEYLGVVGESSWRCGS